MNNELQDKHQKLIEIVKGMGKVCIAFSGGVDSSLLLKVARDELGEKRTLAITAMSNTFTEPEKDRASLFARSIGVKHIFLTTTETSDPEFSENNPDRCYYCKRSFYQTLTPVAYAHGFAVICDGSNLDDLGDYRPGKKAADEFGVRSPLIDAGMSKDDERDLSRELGLADWDRPANACLASRIPYGSTITDEKLSAIGQSEKFLHSLGFETVRVRHHGGIARIEVPAWDIDRLMEESTRQSIIKNLKSFGFSWISVDIEGYRMGSMNESLRAI